MEITKISSGVPWESIVGYSRAIRIGNQIEVSGTTADGKDSYEQTYNIILKVEKILSEIEAKLSDVIRTRIYCTDIKDWEQIGKAHGAFFKDIKPVATMVEVSQLISPELKVEIEFTAVVQSS